MHFRYGFTARVLLPCRFPAAAAFAGHGVGRAAARFPRLPISLLVFTLAAFAILAAGAVRVPARDLGFTPSHVYSMWESVNMSVVAAAGVVSGDPAWLRGLRNMRPRRYSGKVPADVLRRVASMTDKVNALRRATNLRPVPRPNIAREDVTPTDVFLSSGRVQDGVADWLIRRAPPGQRISPFYSGKPRAGKTPSDVYGLVDLANRRMARILEKLKL